MCPAPAGLFHVESPDLVLLLSAMYLFHFLILARYLCEKLVQEQRKRLGARVFGLLMAKYPFTRWQEVGAFRSCG